MDYKVNGAQYFGVQSQWDRVIIEDTGQSSYSDWAINTLLIPQMEMNDFEQLRLIQETGVTTLDTNDIANRNVGKQYTNAYLLGPINTVQEGRKAMNQTFRFRVKVL